MEALSGKTGKKRRLMPVTGSAAGPIGKGSAFVVMPSAFAGDGLAATLLGDDVNDRVTGVSSGTKGDE
jgi:hypothetical protein